MSNPVFQAMGPNGQNGGGMLQSFTQFMNQYRGKDPNAMIQELLQSGRLNQNQLNQVQQAAQQMMSQFDGFKSAFGF